MLKNCSETTDINCLSVLIPFKKQNKQILFNKTPKHNKLKLLLNRPNSSNSKPIKLKPHSVDRITNKKALRS